MVTGKEQRVAKTLELLQKNRVEIASAIGQLFEHAAIHQDVNRSLEEFIEGITSPSVRAALTTAVRWHSAMQWRERQKAKQKASLRSAT
jgi:hypothetical protein